MAIRRIRPTIDPPPRKRRRQRNSVFKKVDLKRAIDGAQRVGLEVGAVEIRPDGTITIRTTSALSDQPDGIFEQWEDRL